MCLARASQTLSGMLWDSGDSGAAYLLLVDLISTGMIGADPGGIVAMVTHVPCVR